MSFCPLAFITMRLLGLGRAELSAMVSFTFCGNVDDDDDGAVVVVFLLLLFFFLGIHPSPNHIMPCHSVI